MSTPGWTGGPAPEDVDILLGAATAAPSLHNSQPWAFDVDGDHVMLYADPTRHLRRTDPAGRSMFISCGAALFNLRVAAEHLGFHPRVQVLPDANRPTLVADVAVGGRHDHGGLHAGLLAGYYPAVAARRTNRLPFHDRPVPRAVLASLGEAAGAEDAVLRIDDDPAEVSRVVGLVRAADATEADHPAVLVERQAWVGGRGRDDGIPVRSLGPRPAEPRSPFRDLGNGVGVARDHACFERTPTVAVLSTLHDDPADWVRAGQALQRVLLEATAAGLSASFMNQPLELGDLRREVRSPATGVGHSQMLLRIGYGDPVPATPRRRLSDVRLRR